MRGSLQRPVRRVCLRRLRPPQRHQHGRPLVPPGQCHADLRQPDDLHPRQRRRGQLPSQLACGLPVHYSRARPPHARRLGALHEPQELPAALRPGQQEARVPPSLAGHAPRGRRHPTDHGRNRRRLLQLAWPAQSAASYHWHDGLCVHRPAANRQSHVSPTVIACMLLILLLLFLFFNFSVLCVICCHLRQAKSEQERLHPGRAGRPVQQVQLLPIQHGAPERRIDRLDPGRHQHLDGPVLRRLRLVLARPLVLIPGYMHRPLRLPRGRQLSQLQRERQQGH